MQQFSLFRKKIKKGISEKASLPFSSSSKTESYSSIRIFLGCLPQISSMIDSVSLKQTEAEKELVMSYSKKPHELFSTLYKQLGKYILK